MSDKPTLNSRRQFLAGTVAGVAGVAGMALTGGSAQAHDRSETTDWTHEADVVVVGSGCAALTAAVFAVKAGARVMVLEKAPISGGTTRKSGGVFWIPNHYGLRDSGVEDRRDDCLRYLSRMAYPERYHGEAEYLGLDPSAYGLLEAFYDNGFPMVDELRGEKVMDITPFRMWHLDQPEPDYQDHLKEDVVSKGRSLAVKNAQGGLGSGSDYIDQMEAWLNRKGVEILTDQAVVGLIQDDTGRVVGVRTEGYDGNLVVRAAKGVIFGTGGYPHNLDLVRNHQRTYLYGSCATPYATGDFIRLGTTAGAQLGNLQSAWRSQALIEECLQSRSLARCVDMPPGDSMFMVNKYGVRAVNEKRNYNDRTEVHLTFDPNNGEFPNQLMFIVYDQRTAELYSGAHPLPSEPEGAEYVIKGNTLAELSDNIASRLASLGAAAGNVALSADFETNLKKTFKAFNRYARKGVDPEFRRGAADYDKAWATFFQPAKTDTRWKIDTGAPNPAMAPLQSKGPYYAMIVGAGALDTNGGPVIDHHARVLDVNGQPIPGLYGAGNCIASPSRNAYFGAGGTIGLGMTFGYIAARHATGSQA